MVRKRTGSWTGDVERSNSPSLLGRRSNALLPRINAIDDDQSSNDARRKRGILGKRHICTYRGGVVAFTFIAFYILLTMATRSSRDPCQVARDNLERLRLEKRANNNSSLFPSDWKPELPKIIHHQWKDDNIPQKYKEWHNKWYTLYPNHTHILWTDESARRLVQQDYSWFLPVYDNYEYPIQRADAARYFYLHSHGGLHTDLDYEPLSQDIFNHLPSDRVGLVESPYKFSETIQNSFMSSPKGDPFWLDVFEHLVKNKHKRVLAATGPQLLDTVLSQTKNHVVHVLACENFHRIPLGESQTSPLVTQVLRGILSTVYPMKTCGNYHDNKCHFARHHNTAVYVSESSWWELLTKM